MSLQDRSFSGKTIRPSPEVRIEDDGSFGVIATPWGPRSTVKRVTEALSDFILSAKTDMENTSPFQVLTCLSPLANTLRAGIMLANDIIYREENKSEYQSGVELLVFTRNSTEIAFVQIGQPHVILNRTSRPGSPMIPIGVQLDLSMEWSVGKKILSPLPHDLLGLYTTSNFQVMMFRPMPGDELIFLSRTELPPSLLQTPPSERTLESLSRILAKDDPDQPFWLGTYAVPVWKNSSEEAA